MGKMIGYLFEGVILWIALFIVGSLIFEPVTRIGYYEPFMASRMTDAFAETFATLVTLVGLIPACIVRSKGHSFGIWWIYGAFLFIIALIHATFIKPDYEMLAEEGKMKKCPYCAEYIKSEAKICRYCGKAQPESSLNVNKEQREEKRDDNIEEKFNTTEPSKKEKWLGTGILVITILVILGACFIDDSSSSNQQSEQSRQIEQTDGKIIINSSNMDSVNKDTVNKLSIDSSNIFSVKYQNKDMYLVIVEMDTPYGGEKIKLLLLNPETRESAIIKEDIKNQSNEIYQALRKTNQGVGKMDWGWSNLEHEDDIVNYIYNHKNLIRNGGELKITQDKLK